MTCNVLMGTLNPTHSLTHFDFVFNGPIFSEIIPSLARYLLVYW